MKKLYFLMVLFALISIQLQGQTILSENFDGDYPEGWITQDTIGNSYTNWSFIGFPEGDNGSYNYCMMSSSRGSYEYANNWLITPSVSLPENSILSFKLKGHNYYDSYYGQFSVCISVNYGPWETLYEVSWGLPDDYEELYFSLSAYANQDVRIGFRNYAPYGTYGGVAIDDVNILETCELAVEYWVDPGSPLKDGEWLGIYTGENYEGMYLGGVSKWDFYENYYQNYSNQGTASIQVPIGVPLYFNWHDPDTLNHNSWLTIFDPSDQRVVYSGNREGQIATYTTNCGATCTLNDQCSLYVHMERTVGASDYNYTVSVMLEGMSYGEIILSPEQSSLDTTLMFCPNRSVQLNSGYAGDDFICTVTDAFGKTTALNVWDEYHWEQINTYVTGNVCTEQCVLMLDFGSTRTIHLSGNQYEPWLAIYAGDSYMPYMEFYQSDWNENSYRNVSIPVSVNVPLRFVWHDPDPESHSVWFSVYDTTAQLQVCGKGEGMTLADGQIATYIPTCSKGCVTEEQCPMYIHLSRENSNEGISVVKYYGGGVEDGEFILTSERNYVDTTLMLCEGRPFGMYTEQGGDNMWGYILDAHGNENDFYGLIDYSTPDPCAQHCMLRIEIGAAEVLSNISEPHWLRIYAGEEELPASLFNFNYSRWNYAGDRYWYQLPLTGSNDTLRFVWTEPDPTNHSSSLVIYDMKSGRELLRKDEYTSLANGVALEYVSTCELDPVYTMNVYEVEVISARVGMSVNSESFENYDYNEEVSYGICWGTSTNPVVDQNNSLMRSMYEMGSQYFDEFELDNLTPNTTYFVRAFAIYQNELFYGNELSFTTKPCYRLTENYESVCDTFVMRLESQVMSEGFENGIPSGWTTVNVDGDSYNWNSYSGWSHTGSSSIYSYAYNSAQDNYLITPAIEVPADGQTSFSWWALKNSSASPHYEVYVSTSPDIADFGESVFSEEPGYSVFQQYSIDLDNWAGQTVYVAFRHNSTWYTYGVYLDDIEVKHSVVADILTESGDYVFTSPNEYGCVDTILLHLTVRDNKPDVTTLEVNHVGVVSAIAHGEFGQDCGNPVTESGICFSTTHNPTIQNNRVVNNEGVGYFELPLNGLEEGTTYYVRAYATNSAGTMYGEEVTFTTLLWASLDGTVYDGTTHEPVPGAYVSIYNKGNNNSVFVTTVMADENGHYSVEGLTTEYYSVIATASGYDRYGPYTTLSAGANTVNVNIYSRSCQTPTDLSYELIPGEQGTDLRLSWEMGGSTIKRCSSTQYNGAYGMGSNYSVGVYHLFTPEYLAYYNGGAISSIGTWFTDDAEYATYTLRIWTGGTEENGPTTLAYEQVVNPAGIALNAWNDITLNTPFAFDGTQNLWVGFQVDCNDPSGNRVNAIGMTDYRYVYNSYGNVLFADNQWNTHSGLNYNWMIRATVVPNGLTYNVLANGQLVASNVTNTNYLVSPYIPQAEGVCYQVVTNCIKGRTSDTSACATVLQTLPTVATLNVSNITSNSATFSGELLSNGNAEVSERGFCWSTMAHPTTRDEYTSVRDNFMATIYLQPQTTYYVRAYATNSIGTAYGNEIEFTTRAECIAPSMLTVSDVVASSALVTWQGGNNNPFMSYELSYKAADATDWTVVSNIQDEFYMLTGLQQNTAYTVRVSAKCEEDNVSPYVEKSFKTGCVAGSTYTIIGEDLETTSGEVLPTNIYYKYSYTQQIYLASEIGGARTINNIALQYFYDYSYTRNVDIYLLHTSKNAFSGNNDWVSVAEVSPVFSGNVTFSKSNEDNWVNIPLTTPFEYNGSDNLVLVFNDKTGSYKNSGPKFYTHEVSAYRNLYVFRDGTVTYDPINPGSGSMSTSCNNFRIPGACISEGCDRANVVVREVTDSSATLILAAAGTNDFELQYAEAGNENYTTIENVTQGTSYVLNNLRQNTSYKVRIRSNCGNEGNSEWKTATFTTKVKNMERLYVTSNGAGDGSSWTNAVNDPNWALNTASMIYQTYGTMPEIWVAEGTYYGATGANSSDAFTIQAGQKLYGGFAGTENSLEERDIQAHPVILDGQNSRRVLYQSTYNYNNSVVIDGFTIRNGYASNSGGGAYLNPKFEVRNCDFINNTSSYSGGAVYVAGSGASNIYNFRNCRFIGNNTSTSGGAVYDNYDYSCYINCKFSGNHASNTGGALYGGRKLVNCEVSNNTANGCSGLYSISDTLINCDIVGNTSNNGYAALMYLQGVMINTVVWGNSSNGIPMNISDYSNMTAINSAVEGGLENNENVINLQHDNYGFESDLYYPMFASPENGDYRLRAGSALIDAGLNEVEMADSDMAGGSRVYDNGTIDVGCYEFHGEEFCSEPYGLEVQNVTGTTALISWHNGNPTTPDHYQIAYRQEGENNWTELTDEISTDYYVLTNLLQQTNYQVKVRAFCNTTNSSEYSVPVTFTTNCSGNYFEELTIGTSTSTTSYVPICPSYKYSYSQQIYLAEEIGDARIIDTLCVQYPSSTVMTRNVDVYMGYTTKTNFSDSYDWIPSSDLTQVYSGEITFTNEGEDYWLAIPVNNFDYNGSGNLVIAFYDHTGSTASSASFYYHSTPDYRTMYRRGSYEVDMTNLGYAYTMYYSCINIRFPKVCTPSSCDRPSITVNDITDSSAVVILATSAENLEVEYGVVGSSEPYTTLPTGSMTIQLNNLKQNTKYEVRGRSVCGANENSAWTKVYFTTPAKNLSRLYVNVAGTGDASSWAEASNDLAWTLDLAGAIKEQFGKTPDIWVAKGTYYGDGTSNSAFTMMDGVNVFGGFYGNEADDYDLSLRDFTENASVLDGQNIQRVLYQPSAFNDQTVWDGFTIQQGNVSNFSSNSNGNCGGGAFLRGKGVLRNCRIINNAAYMGGGVYSYASYSYASGAALEACTVSHNTASNVGAGVYLYYSSLNQCEVSYNTGSGNGAGVYVSYVNSDRDVISNCLVANNTSNNDGAGIYAESRITVLNSTIVNNKNNSSYSAAAVYGGYDQSLIENSIVWGNRNNSGVANLGGGCVCQYSAVEGLPNGTDNIVLSSENDGMNSLYCPRFVNPSATAGSADVTDNVDWHLAENSVCINRGSNDLALAADSVDMEGNARVQMQIVDLGCYESPYNGVTLPEYNGIVYVKENGSGTRDGSSWANAMPSLTEALSLAYMNDADVWVAKGTYYGDSVSSSAFYMVEGVDVYGGFFGNEPADYDLSLRNFTENASVLDGQNNQRVLYQRGHFTTRTVWDGFTMQNGYTYSDYNNSNDDRAYGGGACLKSGSTLSNCLITQNRATSYGGGVYVEGYYYSSYDTTRLLNCTVSHNTSEYYGGGMYLNNRVIANQCRIEYNFSREEGGGAYLNNYVYVINCLIANNSASGSGAGVYASSANVIKNTTIVNNDIRSESGDEFYYNRGAAVYVEYENVYITNCIVWGNKRYGKTNGIHLNSTVSHVTYVAIDDACAGENNIMLKPENDNISASSPHFVKPSVMVGYDDTTSNVNWHLQQGSPCINHGDNSVADVYDLDGNARVQMDTVDMGCYESPYNSIELPKYEGIIYVTQEGGGNFSGDSWTNAMSSVQDAMNFAFMNNAVVWVAAGIYHGNGTSENAFEMKQGVSVYGGFAGDEDANYDLSQRDFESNTSILDGQYRQRVLMQPEGYNDDKAVVWDGFTIQNGRVNGDGAGVYLRGNSTLRNCVVRYNTIVNESSYYSGKYGAGIYVDNDYSELITTISSCVITYNGFEYDQNPGYGAGIYSEYTNIDHTEISHNTSPREGAGLYAGYKTQVSNSLIHHNRTSRKAGGVYVYGSECRFINCDMVNNTSYSNGAGVYSEYEDAEFANCIIWGNKKGYLIDNMAGQTVNMSYCAVEEGYDGDWNVTLASANDGSNLSELYVRFVDPESEDYQLHPASNCIDMGSNDVLTESDTLDFYGNSRIYNSRVDIGCSESQDESSCPSVVNVTVSAVTTNSAHLTWTSNGTETEWVVAYGEVGGDITTATVYDTEYQMEGLRLNRQYMAKVRAVCDDNSMSVFSIPAYFQTSCDPTQLDTLPNFSNLNPSNDVIIYNATVDFSWSSMEHATSYDFYLWKTTDSEPSTPSRSGLTQPGVSAYQVPNYAPGVEYYWKVVAWNECISKTSDVMLLKANKLPDLHVTNVRCSNPRIGQTVTVEWTVKNDGQGNTPPAVDWTDYIWLVHDADVRWYDPNDRRLAEVANLGTLNAGESYTNTYDVTIPTDLNPGNYYLFVFADQPDAYDPDFSRCPGGRAPAVYEPSVTGDPYPYATGNVHFNGVVNETEDNDNFFYIVLTILPPPSPDLQVSSVVSTETALSGQPANVTWTVINDGEANALGSWTDVVFLSSDTLLDTEEDLRVGRFVHEGGLLQNESYQQSAQFTVPVDYDGDYYFIVMTDYNNNVYEGLAEINNRSISSPMHVTMSWFTDLVVTSVTVPSDVMDASGEYICSFTVENQGLNNTNVSRWYDAVYISASPVLNTANAIKLKELIHHGIVRAQDMDNPENSMYSVEFTLRLPDTMSGQRYLHVVTDERNEVFEHSVGSENVAETNNTYTYPHALTVLKSDLVVENITVPDAIDPNEPVRVQWSVRNIGPGNVVNRSFQDYFYFNGNKIYEASMTSVNIPVGESIVRSAMVQLPCADGDATQLTITTDVKNTVFEANETNNSRTVALNYITPDLAVSDVILSHSANDLNVGYWSGAPVELSYTVTNHGSVATQSVSVADEIYFSTSPNSYQASDLVYTNTHEISLSAEGSETYTLVVNIPNGITGNYYCHVLCNADTALCENGAIGDNVAVSQPIEVNLSPSPDLVITQLDVPSEVYIGVPFSLTYTIMNQGTAAINQTVMQKFYYSTSPLAFDTLCHVATSLDYLNIGVNESVVKTAVLTLPTSVRYGEYYIHVVADANDQIYEYEGEQNNNAHSGELLARTYQLDLQLTSIEGPSEMQWGATATYTLHVQNNSSLSALNSLWRDAVYLSTDNVLSSSDRLMQSVRHTGGLEANGEYEATVTITIPYGTPATAYLIGVVDIDNANPDELPSNNVLAKLMTISITPTPDLAISEVVVLEDIIAGQPARLAYKVTNESDIAIEDESWNDKLFVSYNNTFENVDVQLLNKPRRNMTLDQGESYRDTLEFTVPMAYNGNLYLLMIANANNAPYEVVTDNNIAAVPVSVTLPLPGDLVVTEVSCESRVVSGQMLHATWTIQNIGDNPLIGRGLRSLVYVSADTVFDANDRLLGSTTESYVNLGVDQTLQQSLTGRISSVAPGNYYLIVKTDVTNAFNEVSDDNNMGCMVDPFVVTIRPLPFNTDVYDTLTNNVVSDYMLSVVGDEVNQTARIHIASEDSLAGALNMIYATYNGMGNNLNYSYSTIGQYTANTELYIPATQPGYYGVNIYGSTPSNQPQNVLVRADILPFELRAVNDDHGGNTGIVTVELTGSRFRPDMVVSLSHGDEVIVAQSLIYVNYYQVFVEFDLTNHTPGVYDVKAVNFCEGEAVLPNAFTIENGQPSGLAYNLLFPSSPRPNRTITMMLEYGNIGNIDLHNQVLEITSIGGCPIALTPEELSLQRTTLRLPLSIENEPDGLLRPGSYGTLNIYTYSSGALIFTIKPVEE